MTAESQQFWNAQAATEATLKTLRRRVTVAVVITVTFVIIATVVFFVKIDAKFSATQATTDQIRATQVANTRLSDQRAQCQDKAFNAILKDARLAFTGDHNPADYSKAPMSC